VDTIVDVGGRNPPGLHVATRWMRRERGPVPPDEAINERALTGGIKQTQCVRVIAYHHSDRIVIKYLRKQLKIFSAAASRWPLLTVGTYSLGNLFVVYEIRRQV
jgi:predicted signal transduction protein with EAL and GGDEF domain